jgi:hypothetical protein
MAFYLSPIDERLRIDIFLFNSVRRILALLVVFHERFSKRAFLNLSIAGILLTVLPDTLKPLMPERLTFFCTTILPFAFLRILRRIF